MKKTYLLIVSAIVILLAGCGVKQQDFTSGPADKEPPRFETEQALADYLINLPGDNKTESYYSLNSVPDGMEFDAFSSYYGYVDWWYCDASVSDEAPFIYLRWCFLDDGGELLENDLKENGAGRIKLISGDKTFHYLIVDISDGGESRLYDIEWLWDGYLFMMNMPEEYIAPGGVLSETLLLEYTELYVVQIDE